MTRILEVDRQTCAGHGLCYGTAPDLVDSDEQGDPVVLVDPLTDAVLEQARTVVEVCPERALAVREE
jgi:ferredoxin